MTITQKGIERPPRGNVNDDRHRENWTRWFNILVDRFPLVNTYTVTFDPASVAANTTDEQTVTVAGVDVNDIIIVNKPSLTAGLGIVGARASAADTVAITFVNATGAPIDPPSEDYLILTVRL